MCNNKKKDCGCSKPKTFRKYYCCEYKCFEVKGPQKEKDCDCGCKRQDDYYDKYDKHDDFDFGCGCK